MKTRTHELHAALVHAPLVLLPAASIAELLAPRDAGAQRLVRSLWASALGGAALAGVTGLAASQEVLTADARTQQLLLRHGAGNASLLLGLGVLVGWRLTRRGPSRAAGVLGLVACFGATATASLGARLVFHHGVGVGAMPPGALTGVADSVPLASRAALPALLRDAGRGARWLLGELRARLAARGGAAPAALPPGALAGPPGRPVLTLLGGGGGAGGALRKS